MQTRKYRVECVDRDTGAKSLHVFEGENEKAASDLANRMGFLVGGVTEVREDHRRAFPWGVALASLAVGVAIGAGGLFAAIGGPGTISNGVRASAQKGGPSEAGDSDTPNQLDTKAAAEKVPIKTSRARLDKTLAVKREYARFEDKTFVRGGLELRCTDGRWLVLDLFESGTGESEKVLSSVGTQVSIFAKCPEKSPVLNLLLHRDGEVVRLSVKTEYADDGMFLCYIQRPDLEQIAAAETVEAKWWTYEGKLTPDSLVRLREFMQYLF